jgi:threonine dehydrogenase-like Zn-dependent dehydrogenase
MIGVAPGGVVCLTGVGRGGRLPNVPIADVAAEMVLGNNVIIGSVNANKRHWHKGAAALARADRPWLSRIITRRVQPEDFAHAFKLQPTDVKVVLQFAEV